MLDPHTALLLLSIGCAGRSSGDGLDPEPAAADPPEVEEPAPTPAASEDRTMTDPQPGIAGLTPTILIKGQEVAIEGSSFTVLLHDYRYMRARGPAGQDGVTSWADIEIRHEDGRSAREERWPFYEIKEVLGRRFSLRGHQRAVKFYLLPEP